MNIHSCCCCCIASVVSDSVRPHRRQPTRLPRPWDSPGKNTGVGSLFLLQWWFGGVLKSIAGFPGGSAVKNPPSNAGDTGSIPGSERSPGEGGKWQPTPVLLPGKSHRQRNLAGYSPWGHKRDKTEQLSQHHQKISQGHKQELDN